MAKLMNAYSKVHFWSDSEGNIQQQQNPENNLHLLKEEATGKLSPKKVPQRQLFSSLFSKAKTTRTANYFPATGTPPAAGAPPR